MTQPAAKPVNPWWVLIGSCTGLFVLMLDSTVVVLALPAIHRDLGASLDSLQWVQNAYLLTVAAAVVTGGRLGDILGRRRMFVLGMTAFGVGSVIAGAAGDEIVLILGRVVQGLGGAALISLSLALVTNAFDPDRLPRALGIWAAVSAVALAVGPLVGGILIEAASWRWIFFVNIPIVVAGVAIILGRGEESRDPSASRVDLAGAGVLGVGLTAVVFALVEADDWGWGSPKTLGLLAGGLAVLGAFWVLEHRVEAPLVDFSLFRNGPYLGATAAAFAVVGSYWVVMFFQPQYLQDQLGYSAVEAGLMILPVTAPMAVFSPLSGGLIARLGPRATMTAGMLAGIAGLLLQAIAEDADAYGPLLPGFVLFGVAIALVYAPMSTAAMAAMPAEKSGIASGVLAMNRVLAGALLLAVAGSVFQSALPDATGDAGASQFAEAVSHALWPAIIVVAIATAITWRLVPARAAVSEPATEDAQHHLHHRRFHL